MLLEVLRHECLTNNPSMRPVDHCRYAYQSTKTSQVTAPCPLSVVLGQWYDVHGKDIPHHQSTIYIFYLIGSIMMFININYIFHRSHHWWLYGCQTMFKKKQNGSSSSNRSTLKQRPKASQPRFRSSWWFHNLVLSTAAHCDCNSLRSNSESAIGFSPFRRTNPNFLWTLKASIYSTGVFCWRIVRLWNSKAMILKPPKIIPTAVRNTATSEWSQLKFIKESNVQTKGLCWWHPHVQTLECHLHLPERGLRRKKDKETTTHWCEGEAAQKAWIEGEVILGFHLHFSSLEPNHSTSTGDTMSLNQGSNVRDVPKLHVLTGWRAPHTPHTLSTLRVALVEGYICVRQNNIATNPHATSIARTWNTTRAHHQTLQSN